MNKSELTDSAKGLMQVFSKPAYVLLAAIAGFLTFELLIWIFNFPTVLYVLFEAPLTVWEKLTFFFGSFEALFVSYTVFGAASLAIFSFLQGMNVAALVYVLRNNLLVGKYTALKSTGPFALAVIGFGCAACGTSILAPLLASLAAGSAMVVSEAVGVAANILGIFLAAYSLYVLGKASYLHAQAKLQT